MGDDKQAIYAFRGADANALDRLKTELDAVELPLTITYRCPKAVVAQALPLCPDFQAAETAPEGEVKSLAMADVVKTAEPSDFILSRLNAPLAALCLTFYREGKPARIEGRDLVKGLVTLIKRQKADAIPTLLERLHMWTDRETAKLRATKRKAAESRIETLYDQMETIDVLAEGLATVAELLARIEELFGEQRGPAIVLSTIHRAKGLEAARVFLLMDTLYCRGKRINEEESNIAYVGITRAKETLFLVTKGGGLYTSPVRSNGKEEEKR